MNFKQDIIAHTFRNKYLKYTGGSYTTSKASSTTDYTATQIANWFYEDDNGNLHSRLSFVGDKEISAYGAGDDSGTGSVTIIDNLLSNAADCALSANQGRVLNEKIEDIIEQGVGGVTSWNDLEDKPALLTDENIQKWNTQTHTHSNKTVLDCITSAKTTNWDSAYTHISDITKHITSTERTNWNTAYNNNHTHSNKSVLDGITSTKVGNWDGVVTNWNKAFYFDSNNNLRVKLNLVGEGEVSAYGAGSGGGTGIITIVDNLTSTATDCALSANQGRVLKGLIDSKVSSVSWNDIKDKPSTFTPSTHTHNYASTVKVGSTSYNVNSNIISLPAYPTTLKNPNALTISLNGTSQGAYDGSAAKSINITASSVGAAASSHTHTISQITNLQSTLDSKLNSSAYTAADVLSKLKTVDGSGSGLDADLLDGYHLISSGDGVGVKKTFFFPKTSQVSSYIKLGTLYTVAGTSNGSSKVMFTVRGGINFGGTNESVYEVAASTRGSIQVTSTLVRGNRELKFGYVPTSSNVEIWMAYDGNYRGSTEVEVSASKDFTLSMTETTTKPSGFIEGSYRILAATTDNVASATKLQTARTIWGQSFNGTANVSGNIIDTQSVKSKSGVWLDLYGANGVAFYTNNTLKAVINTSGNFGIGTTSPSQKLHVNGNILSTGEITAYSDARLKSNIQTLQDRGYITPVTYIKDGKQSIGFLAQDVQKLYPELVTEDAGEDKYLSLNYAQYTAVLQAQIIELNNRIKQLESKL